MIPNKERLEQIGIEVTMMMPGQAFVMIVFDPLNPSVNKIITNVNDKDTAVVIALANNKLSPESL